MAAPEYASRTDAVTARNTRCDHAQSRWPLAMILLLAAALRLYWLATQTYVIGPEGAEYASIARNLVAGNGYVGSLEGGTQLLFPPLYPILIAGMSLFARDFELSARLVALVCGLSLVATLYYLTAYLYNFRSAVVAALITAVHPLFIRMSTSDYSEAAFIAFSMAGVYWGVRSLEFDRKWCALAAGSLFGLAYLARPEGMFYLAALMVATLLATVICCASVKRAAANLAWSVLGFLIFALPYVAFLSWEVGELRFEGKGPLNFIMAERMNAGMSYAEASYGLGDGDEPNGPVLNINEFIRNTPKLSLSASELVAQVLGSVRRNLRPMQEIIFSPANGLPLSLVLISVGLFSRPWDRRRLALETALFCFFALHLSVLLAMNGLWWRYVFPVLPFFVVWCAHGIDQLTNWIGETLQIVTESPIVRARICGPAFATALVVMLIAICALRPAYNIEFQWSDSSRLNVRKAGNWLAEFQPGPKTIFDVEAIVPYYANGTLLCLPFAEPARCLQYIESKHPDFIVLKSNQRDWRPPLESWFREGIPSENAEMVYESGNSVDDRIRIYRWNSSTAAGN